MALLQSGTRIYGNTTIDTFLNVGANAKILSTLSSTSTTTGALTVAGGLGVAGSIYGNAVYDGGVELLAYTQDAFNQANSAATQANTPTNLVIQAGTDTIAPIRFTAGSNLTTQTAGSIEYDGVRLYGTTDDSGGRGYIQTSQYRRLDANTPSALAITPTKYFGDGSQFNLLPDSTYELDCFLYFTKTTAGTLTVSINQNTAPQFINGTITYGAPGGQTSQAMSTINMFSNPNANAAFNASNTLTTAVNHAFKIFAIIETNASTPSVANVTVWQSAGTLTPLRGSYLKLTRLPTTSNTGLFVA